MANGYRKLLVGTALMIGVSGSAHAITFLDLLTDFSADATVTITDSRNAILAEDPDLDFGANPVLLVNDPLFQIFLGPPSPFSTVAGSESARSTSP